MRTRRIMPALLSLALVATATSLASASFVAYIVPASTAGNQSFTGSLGMDFDVGATSILVSRIGVFDDNTDGISANATLYAEIYDRNTMMVVGSSTTTFTAGSSGTVVGGSRFKDLGLTLGTGNYSIVSGGYSSLDQNGNLPVAWTTNDGGGLISFVGDARHGAANVYPTTIDTGPANRYAAGTFEFSAVPEPTSFLLFGLAMVGFARRRK